MSYTLRYNKTYYNGNIGIIVYEIVIYTWVIIYYDGEVFILTQTHVLFFFFYDLQDTSTRFRKDYYIIILSTRAADDIIY